MARPELGTKRICPETGRKFYDLSRDPIVSPYTGIAYPLSAFEVVSKSVRIESVKKEEEAEVAEDEDLEKGDVDLVALEDVEADEKKVETVDEDIDIDDDDAADDTFLAEEEEDDDDVTGLIDGDIESDEEA